MRGQHSVGAGQDLAGGSDSWTTRPNRIKPSQRLISMRQVSNLRLQANSFSGGFDTHCPLVDVRVLVNVHVHDQYLRVAEAARHPCW
jgi:hypothetical protein